MHDSTSRNFKNTANCRPRSTDVDIVDQESNWKETGNDLYIPIKNNFQVIFGSRNIVTAINKSRYILKFYIIIFLFPSEILNAEMSLEHI